MTPVGFDPARGAVLDVLTTAPVRRRLERSAPLVAARDRFVAGPEADQAVEVALGLGTTGRRASIQPLCRPVVDEATRREALARALEAVGAATAAKGDPRATSPLGVVLVPAALGLGSHPTSTVRSALEEVVGRAADGGVGVTLRTAATEHEDDLHGCVQAMWAASSQPLPLRVSVLARRHRGEHDCARLSDLGIPVRLVRGGPRESARTAWSDRHEADLAYVRCLSTLIAAGPRPMVATHDPALLEVTDALAEHRGRAHDIEYQMYLGAQPERQVLAADAGQTVRVLVPYGREWYDYLADLAERPATLRRLVGVLGGQG